MPQFMGAMLIEFSETRVEASSSDLILADNVAISWTLFSLPMHVVLQ